MTIFTKIATAVCLTAAIMATATTLIIRYLNVDKNDVAQADSIQTFSVSEFKLGPFDTFDDYQMAFAFFAMAVFSGEADGNIAITSAHLEKVEEILGTQTFAEGDLGNPDKVVEVLLTLNTHFNPKLDVVKALKIFWGKEREIDHTHFLGIINRYIHLRQDDLKNLVRLRKEDWKHIRY